jgi:hypothetical protein
VIDGTNRLKQIQTPAAWHLLIQEHDAVGLTLKEDQGIIPMRGRFDDKSLLFQKQDVGCEALYLVIHPENAFRAGHA